MAVEINTYQDALDYLYSFIDYSRERSDRYGPDAFKLDRMRRFLALLGDPHLVAPAIHIAGTKGKGSVACMIASCLTAAGYRTGLYTSPHLIEFRERVQIDGEPISEAEVVERVKRLAQIASEEPAITTYELTTALGFLSFEDRRVKAAVYEVGLGGRLDATNVIDPVVCAITSISYDHTHILGDTLEAIAREKGGIIKAGRPVVIAPQTQEAKGTLVKIAAGRQARLIDTEEKVEIELLSQSLDGQHMRMTYDGLSVEADLPLLGRHQQENAAVAFAALAEANREGLAISPDDISTGLARTQWPGRMQILQTAPPVVVDSAHNVDSIRKLLLAVDETFDGQLPMTVVFGASEDKDAHGMLRQLASRADRIILAQAGHPRALEPEQLLPLIPADKAEIVLAPSVPAALELALRPVEKDSIILVTGSIFVAGECIERWPDIKNSIQATSDKGDRA